VVVAVTPNSITAPDSGVQREAIGVVCDARLGVGGAGVPAAGRKQRRYLGLFRQWKGRAATDCIRTTCGNPWCYLRVGLQELGPQVRLAVFAWGRLERAVDDTLSQESDFDVPGLGDPR
jgi:hypothetical protein